mmetsp:Transcript_14348/g.46829  ORF Transcript_14348/g.46829 Transcript_14348/m.46829 type:complete len:149 (+) Transcript_14348:65-511(+)
MPPNCCMPPFAPTNVTGLKCDVKSMSCAPCVMNMLASDCLVCFLPKNPQCDDEDDDPRRPGDSWMLPSVVAAACAVALLVVASALLREARRRKPPTARAAVATFAVTVQFVELVHVLSPRPPLDDERLPEAAAIPSPTVALPVQLDNA